MGELADKNYIGYKECPKCNGDMKVTIAGSYHCPQCGYRVTPMATSGRRLNLPCPNDDELLEGEPEPAEPPADKVEAVRELLRKSPCWNRKWTEDKERNDELLDIFTREILNLFPEPKLIIISNTDIRLACMGTGIYYAAREAENPTDDPEFLMPMFRRVAQAQLEHDKETIRRSGE